VLTRWIPNTLVEADARALASDDPRDEISRATERIAAVLDERRIAVLATQRDRTAIAASSDLGAGARIASSLARIVASLQSPPNVVIAKGGFTSAVILRDGLGAAEAHVLGPILPGVSLWRARVREREVSYIVVPGNVGGDDLLRDLVQRVASRGE
jgi:uncharacterized protein YgbK (DUF1537 family)